MNRSEIEKYISLNYIQISYNSMEQRNIICCSLLNVSNTRTMINVNKTGKKVVIKNSSIYQIKNLDL